MKHCSLRFCSFELTRVSTYLNISNEFRSERSCLAFSLPKSEARTRKWASRTASLARDTVQKRRKIHTLQHTRYPQAFSQNFHLLPPHFPLDQKKKKNLKHTHLSKNWFPCPTHQNLKSKLSSLPQSQPSLYFSYSWELNHNLLITSV